MLYLLWNLVLPGCHLGRGPEVPVPGHPAPRLGQSYTWASAGASASPVCTSSYGPSVLCLSHLANY